MLILDTDVLTIIQRRRGAEYAKLVRRLDQADDEVAVTIISFEEQMRGWLTYIARAKNDDHEIEGYSRLTLFIADFGTRPVLEYDASAATVYRELVTQKVRIGTMDLKIAAIAIAHGAVLITRNAKDFNRVPNLKVEDWT